jgi:hypothetical protein
VVSLKAKPLSDTDGRGCAQALSDAELFYGTEASKDGKTFFIKVHTRHYNTAFMLCVHDSGLLGTEGVSLYAAVGRPLMCACARLVLPR